MYKNDDDTLVALCAALRTGEIINEAELTGEITHLSSLVDEGMDLNISDENGETALHKFTFCQQESIVRQLVMEGADVDIQNMNGQTALHLAASRGYDNIVQVLLEAGADTNSQTKFSGMTPLHLAAQAGQFTVVKQLLQADTDPNVKDAIGKTADFYATSSNIRDLFEPYQLKNAEYASWEPYILDPTQSSPALTLPECEPQLQPSCCQGPTLTSPTLTTATVPAITPKSRSEVKSLSKPISLKLKYSQHHKEHMKINVFDRLSKKKGNK